MIQGFPLTQAKGVAHSGVSHLLDVDRVLERWPRMKITGGDKRILRAAIFSRFFLFSLVFLWKLILRPYDTSAAINPPCLGASAAVADPPRWSGAAATMARAVVWDGVYFLRVAQCGYEYEQYYAFFPALPLAVSLLSSSVLAPIVPLIGHRAVLALAGFVLNNLAFLIAALYFHRLSALVLRDEVTAMGASVLFCFNPASIFYSSIYSESLYALFSLGGVYHLISGSEGLASIMLAISGAVRSNGAVNAGYICFVALHRASRKNSFPGAAKELAAGGVKAACVLAPVVAFQAYGYASLCRGRDADEQRPWCSWKIPRLYGYVQSHYWDVGFLRYFQVKQLPNFLLASPILFLAGCSIAAYIKLRPDLVFSAGLRASAKEKQLAAAFNNKIASSSSGVSTVGAVARGYSSILVLPFVYHLAFMSATAFFFMHVQVATRFLSASPPIYWFAAGRLVKFRSSAPAGRLVVAYFAAFFLLGSLLFPNFYPFT